MNWLSYLAGFTLVSPVLLYPIFIALFWCWWAISAKLKPATFSYLFWLALGGIIDLWVNLTWGTLLFWQWPHYKRLLLSARMDDLIVNGSGWRKSLAIWVVRTFLQRLDKTGQHTTHGN